VDNQCSQQVKSFKYISCEICYESEQDIQQKPTNFSPVLGILNNILVPKFSKFSRKKVYNMEEKFGALEKRTNND
jgi:hypothetical protein